MDSGRAERSIMKAKANMCVIEKRLGDRTLAAMEKLQTQENRFTKRAKEIFRTPPYYYGLKRKEENDGTQ